MVFKCVYIKYVIFFLGGKHVWKSKSNNKSWVMNREKTVWQLDCAPEWKLHTNSQLEFSKSVGNSGLVVSCCIKKLHHLESKWCNSPLGRLVFFFEQGHHTPNNMEIAHLPRVDPCIKTIIAPMKPVHPWWVDPSWSITLRLWTGLQKSKSFTSWLHIMSLESKLPFKTCCTFTLQNITMSYCG